MYRLCKSFDQGVRYIAEERWLSVEVGEGERLELTTLPSEVLLQERHDLTVCSPRGYVAEVVQYLTRRLACGLVDEGLVIRIQVSDIDSLK